MGEKEIKPADPTPEAPKPQEWHTQVRPGTGTTTPPPDKPSGGGGRRPSAAGGGAYSGHVEFEDGYKMGRDESGSTFLQHPDGGRATWDPGSETWSDSSGGTASSEWSAGHRPTDFGPKR
jgi:hypothetical protein